MRLSARQRLLPDVGSSVSSEPILKPFPGRRPAHASPSDWHLADELRRSASCRNRTQLDYRNRTALLITKSHLGTVGETLTKKASSGTDTSLVPSPPSEGIR